MAIGHIPNTQLFKDCINLDESAILLQNLIPPIQILGVFACGDVQDHVYRQAVTAVVQVAWQLLMLKDGWIVDPNYFFIFNFFEKTFGREKWVQKNVYYLS